MENRDQTQTTLEEKIVVGSEGDQVTLNREDLGVVSVYRGQLGQEYRRPEWLEHEVQEYRRTTQGFWQKLFPFLFWPRYRH